jgi:hypothetical protein
VGFLVTPAGTLAGSVPVAASHSAFRPRPAVARGPGPMWTQGAETPVPVPVPVPDSPGDGDGTFDLFVPDLPPSPIIAQPFFQVSKKAGNGR